MPSATSRDGEHGSRAGEEPILVPGQTCWRIERASRAAFLIDGAAYFEALANALELAQRRVMLLGWDFHSRVALRRDGVRRDVPDELAPMLDRLVRQRRKLRIFVLEWDFAVLYVPERESLRSYRFGMRTHRRVRFRFDAEHPVGASHHQKVVVIDDALAFAGGIDITSNRWDTRAHAAEEPRRVDPDGRPYAPFHDAQMAVDGAPAAALGELARERWRRATGQRLEPIRADHDPWPERLEVHLRDVGVGIARTDPGDADRPPTTEIRALYRESIAAARRWIYIENQYLTAGDVADCLAARLREPDGPEVVIVVPERCSGWLEESSMGALRDHFVAVLREADQHDRLRVFHLRVPGLEDGHVNVHSKLMVVDDRLARIGSANLSNRSMGFDTECDLAIEAHRPEHARAVAGLRDDLLAEHLGVEASRVAETLAREGSLIRAIESLADGERRLERVESTSTEWSRELARNLRVFDPERPLDVEELIPLLGASMLESNGTPRRTRAFALLALSLLALAAWRFTPLADLVEPEALAALGAEIRDIPLGAPLASLFLGLATLVFVPVTALIVACGLVFAPPTAFAVALTGSTLGAAVGYFLGRGLWRDAVRRVAGERFQRISRRFGRRGILATAAIRLVPVAPYGVVNLVAGASHVRFGDFIWGTALAMAPGTAALVLAADRVVEAVAAPDPTTIVVAVAALLGVAGLLFMLRRAGHRVGRDRV